MYQIICDGFILFDPRDEDLILLNPRCKLAANTVGEGSFTILSNHPCYDKLKKLKSIFEIRQDNQTIFRGRMTNNSRDFYNRLDVDLEGVLAYTNDTHTPPHNFPADYPGALDSENIVEHYLGLILAWHNLRVMDWQKLKLGRVTVRDPNNYISRSSDSYITTWDALKTKLFESNLGGYLCVRYEDDGNYVDYLESFDEINGQEIVFGENLLDITDESDASETYSVVCPIGKDNLTMGTMTDSNGNTIEEIYLTDDLVRWGDHIYSKAGVEEIGWVCVPPDQSTWDDITTVEALQAKGAEYLSGVAMRYSDTITIKAVDLHFTDDEIQSFRLGQNIVVNSPVHGVINATYPLTQLDIDIVNPQNTIITIGDTVRTLIDFNSTKQTTSTAKVEEMIYKTNDKQAEMQTQLTYIDADTKNLQEQVDVLGGNVAILASDVNVLSGDVDALAEDIDTIVDRVVEIGTSDIWTLRKWSSGTAECWGSMASEEVTDTLTYPVTFVGDPCIQITENSGKTHYYIIGIVETGESGE